MTEDEIAEIEETVRNEMDDRRTINRLIDDAILLWLKKEWRHAHKHGAWRHEVVGDSINEPASVVSWDEELPDDGGDCTIVRVSFTTTSGDTGVLHHETGYWGTFLCEIAVW